MQKNLCPQNFVSPQEAKQNEVQVWQLAYLSLQIIHVGDFGTLQRSKQLKKK